MTWAHGDVLVGTAGWSDRSLLAAGWYPPMARDPETRLRYYAQRFPLVEVNSTYYGLPSERNARAWAARTPPGFVFNVKAFSLLTHHPTRPAALPAELRPAGEGNVYQQNLAPEVVDEVWRRFLGALEPLRDAGRLGLLLFQFPSWFRPGRRTREYLLDCQRRCAPARICVEFRHGSWLDAAHAEQTAAFLTRHDIPLVCVDMPQGHPDSVPPVLVATSDVAVLRLHGRSPQWSNPDKEVRYRYRYSPEELAEWAGRVSALAETVGQTHVVFNNCYRDDAHTNAAEFVDALAASGARRPSR